MMPLTETTFYVLISVLEPLHGYGIMQKVEKLSHGRILFGPGTLYGAINNLLALGLISLSENTSKVDRKKNYIITIKGRLLIDLEIIRLKETLLNAELLLGNTNYIEKSIVQTQNTEGDLFWKKIQEITSSFSGFGKKKENLYG
jgi:DNA-binding PadR family transcriptional regulator